jgi:hypothetical protein
MRQEQLRGTPPKTEVLPLIPFTPQPTLPPIPAPLPRAVTPPGPTGPDGAPQSAPPPEKPNP